MDSATGRDSQQSKWGQTLLTNYLSLAGGGGGKLEHVEVVRLRYGKAEARSDTRKEVRRLGSREVVA